MKLSILQRAVLHRCVRTGMRSTAQVQNTARSLVRRGLVIRQREARGVYLYATPAGAAVWSRIMADARARIDANKAGAR